MMANKLKLVWPREHQDMDIVAPISCFEGLLIIHLDESPHKTCDSRKKELIESRKSTDDEMNRQHHLKTELHISTDKEISELKSVISKFQCALEAIVNHKTGCFETEYGSKLWLQNTARKALEND